MLYERNFTNLIWQLDIRLLESIIGRISPVTVTIMARVAACPKCRKQFSLPPVKGPATIACPFCQAHITIRVRSAAAVGAAKAGQQTMVATRTMAPPTTKVTPQPQQSKGPPGKKKKKKKGNKSSDGDGGGGSETGVKIAIVGGILLLTIVCLVIAFWYFMSDTRPKFDIPKETVPAPSSNNSF